MEKRKQKTGAKLITTWSNKLWLLGIVCEIIALPSFVHMMGITSNTSEYCAARTLEGNHLVPIPLVHKFTLLLSRKLRRTPWSMSSSWSWFSHIDTDFLASRVWFRRAHLVCILDDQTLIMDPYLPTHYLQKIWERNPECVTILKKLKGDLEDPSWLRNPPQTYSSGFMIYVFYLI